MERVVRNIGWIKSKYFDLPFLFLIPIFAILGGYVVGIYPDLFQTIVLINFWLLGYHHVVSTYTRIAFSFENVSHYKFLVFYLPFIVLFGVLAIVIGVGVLAIATIYLYWQWFHYTRQSSFQDIIWPNKDWFLSHGVI